MTAERPAPWPFVHTTRPLRVVFRAGAARDPGPELDRLGASRTLLLTTPGGLSRAEALLAGLGPRLAGTFSEAAEHVPEEVAAAAARAARQSGANLLLAFGGGSAIGTAKAAALATGLPLAAVPTTCSGSEMTSVWGIRRGGAKETGRDERAAPRLVLYDPCETLELPALASAESGVNAIAHAVEALYAPDRTPLSGLLAEEAIRALAEALPGVMRDPSAIEARSGALYGAHLAGWALELSSMGLHHKLAHILGGSFDLPHARVHALLLPHTAAFNAPAAPGAMVRIARALGTEEGPAGLATLNRTLGLTATLADLGLSESDLDEVARQVLERGYPNPRAVNAGGVRHLLQGAWEGGVPSSRS